VTPIQPSIALPALAELVPYNVLQRDYWGVPKQQAPLRAVLERNWKYIRRVGEVDEELFHLTEDTKEQRNLARHPSAQTTLQQMRATMDRLTLERLLPERFTR
jgi:arylsulfatase A-like enzyme